MVAVVEHAHNMKMLLIKIYFHTRIVQRCIHTCTVEEDLCFRVVVVDIMVVVSIKVVDISGDMAVVLAEPAPLGTSPTNLTLPLILMLGLPSAAMLNTFRPL